MSPTVSNCGDDPKDDQPEENASRKPQQQNKHETDQHAYHQTTENIQNYIY